MVEGRQFKTRLCVLYQRGRCNRNNCSFAHGNAELRRHPASASASSSSFSACYVDSGFESALEKCMVDLSHVTCVDSGVFGEKFLSEGGMKDAFSLYCELDSISILFNDKTSDHFQQYGYSILVERFFRIDSAVNGRRDYSANDLRDKLQRRYLSPPRRYSPARDGRGRQAIREYSPSRSPEKRSDRRHMRKHGTTDQSDIPGSSKVSDRIQDRVREGKLISSGSRNTHEEQLKKVESDINTLEDQKFQLEVYLDESVQEIDSLNSRIQELDAQLFKEKEECKRIASRIRKFIRVHHHNSQLQDELKRSQVRLQRFGDELVSDISRIGASEEDLSIDIVSNGENSALPPVIKHNAEQNDASPLMKRLQVEQDPVKELKQDRSKVGNLVETSRTRKRSRWNLPDQLNDKDYEGLDAPSNGTEVNRPLDLEGKQKRGIWSSSNNPSSEKLKESKIELPSTSMAAHVVDDEVEIEHDDRTDIMETAKTINENGVAHEKKGLPLLLPPTLIPRSNYSRYEGEDENVDVDGLEEKKNAGEEHVGIV
ncbi:hypothetical protein RIF29_31553 [Crotalaria pallida]|uniref:C3H1-type domain-containing protein n=1 Tax=Crotalaria pallida TaxID=3830 RepID=A0AAN9EJQ8_CROPI